MTMQLFRTGFAAIAVSTAAFVSAPATVCAQTEVKPGEETGHIAIVKGSDVYVRCGAAESYYTFTKLNDGDMVRVTGEKYEWSRIMPIGPGFENAFGFVKYGKHETGRFRLSSDGKSGQTMGKIDIIAPNFDARNNPKDSWKSLVRLEADQTLRVLETTETDKDIIHRVALPEAAQGWVSTARLEKASPEQAKQWTQIVANHNRAIAEGKPAPTTPASAPTAPAKPNSTRPQAPGTPSPAPTLPTQPSVAPASNTAAPAAPESSPSTAMHTEEGTTTPSDTTTSVPMKSETKLPTLDDLEAALKNLQKEAIETAEVGPLRELYLDLARRSAGEARIVRYANGRGEQLQVWADIQKKRGEVDALRTRAKMSAEEAIAVQQALESSAEYTVVGKVITSTIYDGKNLPQLLRLQDASTGRTVAYLRLDEKYQAANLIGNLVGIVGDKSYDGSLRLNIVEPRRIDILLPEATGTVTVTVPTDQPRPDAN
jgi:hypothetical protein